MALVYFAYMIITKSLYFPRKDFTVYMYHIFFVYELMIGI